MKKIAIIIGASIYNQKGLFNAAHERSKQLVNISDAQIDLYLVSTYKTGIVRILSREKALKRPNIFIKDGLTYRIIWIKNTILDYILLHKLGKCRYSAIREFKRSLSIFKCYDLIIGHTTSSFVWQIYKTYRIPYFITWHGSDIHTMPFQSSDFFHETKKHIEHAAHNFFVSKALLDTSDNITKNGSKSVSYNGRDLSFISYSTEKKEKLRKEYGVGGKRVVSFVGNLIPIKNVKSLPAIFRKIYREENNVVFWIFGEGPLMESLKVETSDLPIRFWGNVEHDKMVDFMNMMDILVIPSLNEGLPLVTLEALSCGCYVVGSRVGGIPESIGIENTVSLNDPMFSHKLADRAIELLKSKPSITIDECFSWRSSAQQEFEIIKRILKD